MKSEQLDTQYDIIIIGAGPIGLACAIEAIKSDLKYVIIEKGCLVNSLYNYPMNMTFFSTSERLEIGGIPFVSISPKPTRNEALEYYRRVAESWNITPRYYERVESVTGGEGDFIVTSSKGTYRTRYVIAAMGFYDIPNLLNIPGEDLPKVKHYYHDPHPYVAQKVAVIGGGNSAVDAALETYRKGARVTMIIKKSDLDSGVKYWIRPDIENRIKNGEITAYFHASVIEVTPESIVISTPEGTVTVENDFVLAMTGYHADFSFLSKIGVTVQEAYDYQPYHDPDTFETNHPGIFLAGVVCCGLDTRKWYIENSRYHAENVIREITKRINR